MKKDYQTILKTTNAKGKVIEICYDPLSCDGYNIFIDNDKLVGFNTQCYCDALIYVYKELHGFEELRVLFPNYGLEEDDFICILSSLEADVDKVIIKHEAGEIYVYNCDKDKITKFLNVYKDGYKNLKEIINSKHLVEFYETKESFLDSIKEVKDLLEEDYWNFYLNTKISKSVLNIE